MFKLLLLNLVLFAVVTARIAKEGEAPYQASIRTERGHTCSGAIYDKEWLITSANCVINVKSMRKQYVVVGTSDVTAPGTSFPIDVIHLHPNYNTYRNDIAVVQINGTMKFNDKIQPALMPERNTLPGANLLLSGWKGRADTHLTNKLLLRNATSITKAECEKEIGPRLRRYQICAVDNEPYGDGAEFFDDRGGPVVEGNKLAAIVSVPLRYNRAGVHTRIYEFLPWIVATTNPDSVKPI